jgi:hypothetical protein
VEEEAEKKDENIRNSFCEVTPTNVNGQYLQSTTKTGKKELQ